MNAFTRALATIAGVLTVAVASMLGTTSCISDDVTTSPSNILTFSRDTVSFDTIFTDVGTPTARLVVHNRASKSVIVSSIRFRENGSHFRMNVDGVSGSEFHDVEIRAKDSIYVFIECKLPEQPVNEPVLVEDRLEFITNGVTQNVLLEAWGQNVTRLRGVELTSDTRFTTERPYVVYDSLIVTAGVTLTVDPAVKLLFHDKAYLRVYGTLNACGRPGEMIDMRGDRLDNVLPDISYDIMSGQWQGVSIAPESFGNRLEYVDMRSTVKGLSVDSCADLSRTKLTLLNSWLHNSQRHALDVRYAKINATGCCFSESAAAVVNIVGGEADFLQCTFANNYLFAAISQPIVVLSHLKEDDKEESQLPLMKARFFNSIIYGLPAGLEPEDFTDTDVIFRNVSFKEEGSDDDNFINCLWNTDPMFFTVREDYYFNYRLQPDSPVKEAGNPELLTPEALIDMDGVNRLENGNPSLGAYQFVKK